MQMTSTGGKEGKVRKRSENVRRGFPNRNPRLLAIFWESWGCVQEFRAPDLSDSAVLPSFRGGGRGFSEVSGFCNSAEIVLFCLVVAANHTPISTRTHERMYAWLQKAAEFYWVSQKKCTNRMLLEPWGTGETTSGWHHLTYRCCR